MSGDNASVVFAREPLHPAIDEAAPMLAEHLATVTPFGAGPWEPHWFMFDSSEAAGIVRTWTVRREGRLLGIAIFAVIQHPFYRALIGQQQAFCLDPAARGAGIGRQFLQHVDAQLKAEGCNFSYQEGMPAISPAFPHLLEREGYRPVSVMFAKEL